MDRDAIAALEEAGVDVNFQKVVPHVGVRLDPVTDEVMPVMEEVDVICGEAATVLPLKSIPDLFAGSKTPPDFAEGPTDEYLFFFATIETTAADLCSIAGIVRDDEFERTYRLLRKRPAERRGSLLFSYVQAAVRLYMSLRDVSQAELEAVLTRLSKSARTFRMGPTSMNYYDYALTRLLGRSRARW